MAAKSPIEIDMRMSAATRPLLPKDRAWLRKNCDFLQIFHNFYVLNIELLVLTMHLVSF